MLKKTGRHEVVQDTTTSQNLAPPQTLQQAVDSFLQFHAKKQSASYRKWLRKKLNHLIKSLGPDMPINGIQIMHLDAWYSTVLEREWSDSYKNGFGRAAKVFFRWLGKRRYILSNPAALLELNEIEELPPKSISYTAASALLDVTKQNPRDHALIRFLLFTGARANEAATLTYNNLHLADRYAIVAGKGRRGKPQWRAVAFDSITADCIQSYVDTDPHTSRYVFHSQRPGEQHLQITSNAIRIMIDRYKPIMRETYNITEPISPHRLRHTWAVLASERRGEPSFIQEQMGHKDFNTTRRYIRFQPHSLRDAYDRTFGQGLTSTDLRNEHRHF